MTSYVLELVDRGVVRGVPVVDVYLFRDDGGVQSLELCSTDRSPRGAEELASAFAELGVRVERVRRLLPGAAT